MSNIRLTCAESPLAWPINVSLTDLNACDSCGIKVYATQAGSLQILTRRQGGGVGDGVNIQENPSIGADYRGQRYAYEEAIFHSPGMHIFPGQSDVYPAEYHIHMKTMAAPFRFLTLVIPASQLVPESGKGAAYFAACRQTPTGTRPALDTLLTESQILQYAGPDVRGRTDANSAPADICNSSEERQFLLVLNVVSIRPADLYRILREGSLSADPKDWPAPGVRAKKAMPSDRLLKAAVLANPGVLVSKESVGAKASKKMELECKPVEVVNGRDVIKTSAGSVDIKKLLGLDTADEAGARAASSANMGYAQSAVAFFSTLLGLIFADWLLGFLWPLYFSGPTDRLTQWEPIKIWVFLFLALAAAGLSKGILKWLGIE